jgi:hypothetical protein
MVRVDQNYLSSTQYQIRVSPAVTNVSATSPVFTITGLQIEDVVDESGTSYALNHQFCPGDYLGVEFDMNNAPNAGNYYIAEISNNNFTTSTTIGQIPSVATSGTIPAIIPYDAAPGTGYVLRIRATDPELGDSEDYTTDYDILIDPTITTQPAAQYDVCLGDDVDITVGSNNTNSRQWEKLCLDSFFVTLRDTSALGADAISSVAKSGNNIYVGTFNGLSYYDGSTWSVINTGLSDNQINDVFFDPSTNRVYLSTADGLTILDSDGMNPIVVKPPNIPSNQVNQIYADGNDIYVATSGGLKYLQYSNLSPGPGALSVPGVVNSIGAYEINALGDKVYYAGTLDGLFIGTGPTDFAGPVLVDPTPSLSPEYNQINDVFVDQSTGIIYVATGVGVVYSTDGALTWTRIEDGLDNTSVSSVFVEGDLIFATTPDGLAVATVATSAFTLYTSEHGIGYGAVSGANDVFVTSSTTSGITTYTICVATLGGLSQAELTLMNVSNAPPRITGATTATLDIDGIIASDALCRYRLKATSGDGCVTYSNFTKIGDIPPTPVLTQITPSSECTNGFGSVEIRGLVPGVEYILNHTETGDPGNPVFPMNGETFTAGSADSSLTINLLDTGLIRISITSMVAPDCTSDTLEVLIEGPDAPTFLAPNPGNPPANPYMAMACQNEQVTIEMEDLPTGQQYRWYDNENLTGSPIATTNGSFTPSPVPGSDITYYVIIRDANTSCISEDTVQVDVVIKEKPDLMIISTADPTDSNTPNGQILLGNLNAGENYVVTYTDPDGNSVTVTPNPATASATGQIPLTALAGGAYNDIQVTSSLTGCSSPLLTAALIPNDVDGPRDNFTDGEAATKDEVCGGTSGYFQTANPDISCATDLHRPAADGVRGIVVGRIRNPLAIIPSDPTDQPTYPEPSEVNFNGYVIFDLFSMLPEEAYIDKVEFAAKADDSNGNFLCDVPLESATGDIQFDVTRMDDTLNYGPYPFGYNSLVNEDLENQKYADFTIARNKQGAWTDLGPQAAKDMQDRLALDGRFQVGLTLSGSDFDLPLHRLHGIVFESGESQKLRVTYHVRDYGDLPELKYTVDLVGGVEGPWHRADSVDVEPDTAIVTLRPTAFLGATPPDAEFVAFESNNATGDDVNMTSDNSAITDDEDLDVNIFVDENGNPTPLLAGEIVNVEIPARNNMIANAYVYLFIDFNNDGDFEDQGEYHIADTLSTTDSLLVVPAMGIDTARYSFLAPNIASSDTIAVRVRISSSATLDANGGAPNGEVEDFFVELRAKDFGDLNDITVGTGTNDFQTLFETDGPRHGVPVVPLVYLGDNIDTEADGQPADEADGDDTDSLTDDEDGVIFLTPFVPGKQATIAYFPRNRTDLIDGIGVPATFYVFGDLNNDGILDSLSQAIVPAGASGTVEELTFDVPEDATFDGGNAFFRFRITTDTALTNNSPTPFGPADDGEVEDYYVPIFSIGSLVWEDRNHNGFQDEEEIPLGIDSMRVIIRYGGVNPNTGAYDGVTQVNTRTAPNTLTADGAGDDFFADFVCDTLTAADGTYRFIGLIEGNYQLISIDSFDLTPTRPNWIDNVTEEDRDSDGMPLEAPWAYTNEVPQARTEVFLLDRDSIGTDEEGILDQLNPQLQDPNRLPVYPDNRFEQRVDFGYVAFDFGDLPDTYLTLEDGVGIGENVSGIFPTDSVKVGNPLEGPKHIVTPEIYLGQCADAETLGQPDLDAGQEVWNGQGIMPVADGLGDNPNAGAWNTADQHDTPTDCSNDENGVTFLTPLVPGSEAIISVAFQTSVNNDGPDAYLQAYFDWNGDGDFYDDPANPSAGLDDDEQIIFTYLNDDTLYLEPNTNAVELEMSDQLVSNPVILKFNVPEGALFQDGNFLGRFRIGKVPNLGPTGILPGNENFEDGIVPLGEVEDYFLNLVRTSTGNIVWEDRDYDGIQDLDEPVIPGVKVTLEYAGEDDVFGNDPFERTYMTETNENGAFIFAGLIGQEAPTVPGSKYYRIIVSDPDNMTPTVNRDTFDVFDLSNCVAYNSDGYDSNIDDRTTENYFRIDDPLMMCVEEQNPVGKNDIGPLNVAVGNTWPDNQIDETIDFGFVGFDYGDLPDTSSTDPDQYDYITLRDWLPGNPNYMGPRHAIQPRLYLGDGVDGELNAQPDLDAGSKAGGDDDFAGEDPIPFTAGDAGADDETGIRLLTPLLPGEYAFIRVDYTSQDTVLAGGYEDRLAFLNGFIDWNGDGDFYDGTNFDASEAIEFEYESFTTLEDGEVDAIGTPGVNGELPGGENLYKIFGFRVPDTLTAQFYEGAAFMRFRLSWTGDLDPDNRRYHQATDPHVDLATEPASASVAGPIPDQVDALSWTWADTFQTYPQGEVEDYAIPLAKIGNLAWYDHNVNGRQDGFMEDLYNTYVDEYGVDTLHLVLIWGGVDNATGDFDAVGYQDTDLASAGTVFDIQYNLSIAPQDLGIAPDGLYEPTDTIKTNGQGLYSFRGLIPGNYNLIPLKYLQTDSMSFVNYWPKHRVLTVKNNSVVSDSLDSDAGPGVAFTIADANDREPEVCVDDLPLGEDGQLDLFDRNDPNGANMGWGEMDYNPFFPDSLYDQTIDFGWVDEPNIEASLDLVGVDFPTTETCGNFNVIYHLCLKNPTETPLDSIVPFLNIAGGYGAAFVPGTAEVSIVERAHLAKWVADSLGIDNCEEQQIAMEGSVADLTPYINTSYKGRDEGMATDTMLLTGGDVNSRFYLAGDSVICIRIEFEVNPEIYAQEKANGVDCPWMLRGGAYARAVGFSYDPAVIDPWTGGDTKVPLLDWMKRGEDGQPNERFGLPIQVYDLSDEFDDVALNEAEGKMAADSIQFEGYVVDRGDVGEYKLLDIFSRTGRDKYLDEDDYVVQNDECWEKTKNPSVNDNIILGLDENCEIKLDARNFVNDYEEECGFDTYPEGSYYRVIIKDEHTGEVLWASVDRIPFDGSQYLDRKLIFEVRAVADFCQVTWGRITIEDKRPPIVTCAEDIDEDDTNNMLLNAMAPLVCTDIDSILNNPRSYLDSTYAYFTGIATAVDNCTGEVIFDGANDVLEVFSDCEVSAANGYAYARIIRTFLFRDVYGNKANCKQEIYFYRPQIILPECEIDLYRYDVGADRELTPADLISKYEQAEAVPYIINAAGDRVYLTDETICGFGLNWENESTFVSDACTFKIEREWRIFDWCYSTDTDYPNYLDTQTNGGDCYMEATREGNVYIFKQLLKVEDRVDPVVRIPDFDEDGFKGTNGYKGGPQAEPTVSTPTYDAQDVYVFSTQGTDCLANFSVTKDMFEVEEDGQWCFDLEDIMVRQPVLDLDERPIPGEFELVVDEWAQISGSCEAGGFWVDEVRMRLDTSEHYLMRLRFYDECGNDTLIYAPFEVIDNIKPVVICDDELRVTYDNLGTGSLAAVDVDEGTYDNCGKIIWLKVRRPVLDCEDGFRSMLSYVDANNNSIIDEEDYIDENDNNKADSLEYFRFNEEGELMSPLLDRVHFFCCDPDQVKVELWASDKFGNVSNCWQYATLENKPPLVYDLPGNYILPNDRIIDCETEPQLQALLQSAGNYAEGSLTYRAAVELLGGDLFISLNAGCAVYTKQINVRPEVDQCGQGSIYISWTLSNGEDELTTVERELTIRGSYDYWLKFPQDVYANCSDPSIEGVEYETNGCDLIAISQLPDERFETPQDPNSCYKLLRTYRVINWCEYDGESQPVVVSRDWDAHNGSNYDCATDNYGTDIGRNPSESSSNRDDVIDAGEYNLNPMEPDGDGVPGDEDIYVIVSINNADGPNPLDGNNNGDLDIGEYDIVYYDNNSNPFDNSTADLWGDDDVSGRASSGDYPWGDGNTLYEVRDNERNDEGYWWAVVRGETSCESPGQSAWYDDDADGSNTDVDGNDVADDGDNRYGSFGYWQYTQHIVVYDAIDPELTVVSQDTFYSINAVDCDAQVQIEIAAEDICNGNSTNVEIQVVVDGVDASDGLVAGVFTGRYAEGEHELIISASDACRNAAVYRQTFMVADGKAPTPIVHDNLVAELSEMDIDGETVAQAEVWASDFVASDIYDCNGQDATQLDANGNALVTKYSINRVGDSVDVDQTGLVFTCADVNQTIDVEIHAWDEAGNHDYVVTSVLVQDNNGVCDVAAGTGQISGGIATEENARVNEVEVRLSGADQRSYLTNATGTYSFTELQDQGDFTVIPSKDDYHENGITTFDVILLQKHIVGSEELESPYKQIAADVNRSGTITTLDLIQLRKIVLGIDTRFAENTSWRFVDADFRFRDGVSALTQAFGEVKNINNLSGSEEANFFAVKTGDLNASASAYVQPRSGEVLTIEASGPNRQLQAGQEYRIDFRSSELAEVQGYQFTLELGAGIELVDMIYAQAQAEHFGVFADRGVITTSWNGKAQGHDLFSVVIRPDAAVLLEDVLRISSHYTAAEAYNGSDEIMELQLDWSTPVEVVNSSALYQNEPNPFTGETQIGFRLAEADRANIRIRDVQGRLVLQHEGVYAAGVHQLRVKREDLPSAGVYYYTLQAGDFVATKKLILLD